MKDGRRNKQQQTFYSWCPNGGSWGLHKKQTLGLLYHDATVAILTLFSSGFCRFTADANSPDHPHRVVGDVFNLVGEDHETHLGSLLFGIQTGNIDSTIGFIGCNEVVSSGAGRLQARREGQHIIKQNFCSGEADSGRLLSRVQTGEIDFAIVSSHYFTLSSST
ncbi:hypothetical protein YC2023_050759 [Brassica napus]